MNKMNELITELAEHANYLATEKEFPYDEDWFYLYNQLFAELIVRECVDVCNSIAKDRAGCHDSEGRDTAYSCGDEIKEHFGVE
jgi:hypothetical protein